MDKNCDNCINSGRPSYEWPCTVCTTAYGSAPSKWESIISDDDFVKVVRCKDCRFYEKETVSCSFVTADANWYEEDFCSYGERRTDE